MVRKISRRRATLHAHAAHTHTRHNCVARRARSDPPPALEPGCCSARRALGWKGGQTTRLHRVPADRELEEHDAPNTHLKHVPRMSACTRTCMYAHANSVRCTAPPLAISSHTLTLRTAEHKQTHTSEPSCSTLAMPSGRKGESEVHGTHIQNTYRLHLVHVGVRLRCHLCELAERMSNRNPSNLFR